MDAGFNFMLQMETTFQFYVDAGSQMVHEMETSVLIYVNDGFRFRFHFQKRPHTLWKPISIFIIFWNQKRTISWIFVYKLQQFRKSASIKYCTLVSKTIQFKNRRSKNKKLSMYSNWIKFNHYLINLFG